MPLCGKITTAGAVLSHGVLAVGLLEAVPVGDKGENHYLVVPVEKFPQLELFSATVSSLAD